MRDSISLREQPLVSPMHSTDDLTQETSSRPNWRPTRRYKISENNAPRDGPCSGATSADEMSNFEASDDEDENDHHPDYTTSATSESETEFMECQEVEDFRDREYPQLKDKIYLDHGGTTLYAKSLIEEFSADLIANLYGNPHSASSPSALAGHRIDAIREKALRFFNADPAHWDLIFTANATASIKLVIECFRDHAALSNTPVWYGFHRDAHTSLVGVRELTKMHRCFSSDNEVDIWINSGGIGGPRARQLGLFAYPGQSNMTGRRLPLNWGGRIRKQLTKASTYTLLDAAALASTMPLDLSDHENAPDFVALSFYKIFGFPNIGALLVRKASSDVLSDRKYFGGGTVDMIITINDTWHAKKEAALHDRLEDGTLPFHSIFALDHAIDVHERLYGPNPMKFISQHTSMLAKQLYDGLAGLHHGNGVPVATIYKDENAVYGDPSVQGATLVFNVRRSDGSMRGYEEIEEAADARGIFLRSGSLCNPGGVATYLQWTPAEMRAAYAAGHRCSAPTQVFMGKSTGVVRVSLGAMSTPGDIIAFLHFIADTYQDANPAQQVANVAVPPSSVDIASRPKPQSMYIPSSSSSPTSAHPPALGAAHLVYQSPNISNMYSQILQPPDAASTSDAATTCSPETPRVPYTPSRLRRNHTSSSIPTQKDLMPTTGIAIEVQQQQANELPRSESRSQQRQGDQASVSHGGQTGSVKSKRSFGRSVVSLLHRKGHTAPYDAPDMPTARR